MRVLTRPNLGGPTRQAVALWHAHAALGVRTLLVTGRCEAGEASLPPAGAGVPAVELREALAGGAVGGGWVEVPDLGRGLGFLRDRRAGAALAALVAGWRPEVVHTHTSKAGLLGRRAARAAGEVVLAHTFHGHVLAGYFGPLANAALRLLERRLAAGTELLFAVSPSCADELAALGVAARSRFTVVPPAVACPRVLDRAAARAALGVPPGAWLAACIGRLVPIKRVGRFVQAVAALPELQGEVWGDGPLGGELRAAAGPRVRFRGADPAVASLLAAYDALVVPSAREGCPLAAVEAFAAGVPVVGFDVPGVRDVLGPWGGGVLVEEGAGAAGLAAALRRLREEPGLQARCTAAGRAGLTRYAPEAVAAEILAAYEAAARDRRAGYAPPPPG